MTCLFFLQYLHYGFGSGVDQEQRRGGCHGTTKQTEIQHHLRNYQMLQWILLVSDCHYLS